MNADFHSSRRKGSLSFEEWAAEVRKGIPDEEAKWVSDGRLKEFYDRGMIVFEAWYEVQFLYEDRKGGKA